VGDEKLHKIPDSTEKKVMAVPALKEESGSQTSTPSREGALFDIKKEHVELGAQGSLRHNILLWVLEERYDDALEGLREFLETPSEYPNFKGKIERFVHHAIDLIFAIKAKRSFPGLNSLTRAKQQELREKFKSHYRELQNVLKIVEKIETDLRIRDARSTIYIVRALSLSVAGIVLLALYLDITGGLAKTGYIFFDELVMKIAELITGKFKL